MGFVSLGTRFNENYFPNKVTNVNRNSNRSVNPMITPNLVL